MPRILLLDPDTTHARALALALERHRYSVAICSAKRDALNELKRDHACFDVMILDLSANRPEEWAVLDEIRQLSGLSVAVLCLSEIYRGPRMKLEVERKGARLVVYDRR